MVLHNPNNWHWVNKDAREWTKDYFSNTLTTIEAEENSVSAKITKVLSVDGDVDVNQRKGKVVTIFDVQVKLEYTGKNADGVEANGTILVPEVAHDTAEDEYVFEITNYSDTKDKQSIRDLVRNKIVPQLRKAFAKLSGDLIEHHGKDIQHVPSNDPAKKAPSPAVGSSAAAASPKPVKAAEPVKARVVNTVTLNETYEFNTSADQLYQCFVDPQRVAAFTRGAPSVFEPKEGGKFVLFGGNVEGSFKALEPNKKIVQEWRLKGWPEGHSSTLELVFDQGTDTTNLRVKWTGVPVGQEEVSKRNFEDYYVRSIKTTFGYAVFFHPSRSASPTPRPSSAPQAKKDNKKSLKRQSRSKNAVIQGNTWQDKLEVAGPAFTVAALVFAIAYAANSYWG